MSFESHVYEVFSGIIEEDGENFFKTVGDGYGREIATILENEDISQRSIQKELIKRQNIRMRYLAMYTKEKRKRIIASYVDGYRKKLSEAKDIYEIHMLKATLEQQKIEAEDESFFLPEKEKKQLMKEVLMELFSAYKKIIAETEAMYEVRLLKEKLEQRKIEAEEDTLSFFTQEEESILFDKMDAKLEELDQRRTSASMRKKFLAQGNPTLLPAIVKSQENDTFIKKEKEALAS